MRRTINDRHIHIFAGEPEHCIHCGCTWDDAHDVDPILYPDHLEALMKQNEGTPLDSGMLIFTPPPTPNVHIHFGDPPGDFVWHFIRTRPFTRLQVWMWNVCFGGRVEQDTPWKTPTATSDSASSKSPQSSASSDP